MMSLKSLYPKLYNSLTSVEQRRRRNVRNKIAKASRKRNRKK